MTDHQFTDDDLRAAAALMHYGLTIKPNPADADAALGENPRWFLIKPSSEHDEQLREATVELVSKAADVSRWAVDLGADGLEPDEHVINVGWNDGPLQARIHIAFPADTPDGEREQFVTDIANAIAGTVPVR